MNHFLVRARMTVVVALIPLSLFGCAGEGGRAEFMSLATAGTGGVYYPLGGAIAQRLSRADTLRQYTAEVSGGSVENVNRLRTGQVDLAFATGNTVYEAYHGGQDYPEPVASLRILAPLYPNLVHVVARDGLVAASLSDMEGGTVSVGPPGSGTEQMARQILEVHGLNYENLNARYLSFSESALALKDRAIDAAIISVGYPGAAVLEAMATANATLLSIDADRIEALARRYPYYLPAEIPQDAYPNLPGPVATTGTMNWVVARDDLPDEVARHLLRVLTEERAELVEAHQMVRRMSMEDLRSAPIPVHDATQAWMDENLSAAPEGP